MANAVEMTAEEIEDLAERLRWVAARYQAVAAEMRRKGIPSLSMKGVDTIRDVIIPNRLAGHAGTAERALLSWHGEPQKIPEPIDLATQIDHAKLKVAARRSKKAKRPDE